MVRTGGDPAWRNNNPGNLRPGAHSRIHGSIGTVGGFAVFPSYDKGREALVWLFKKETYQKKTVFDAVDDYAPAKDKNNPDQYRKNLSRLTGLRLDRKIKDLSNEELVQLVDAIEKIEGKKRGTEETFRVKEILDVQTGKKSVIVAYLVEDLGWKSKAEVIGLIGKGFVDGVVVKKGGKTYIRTRPDQTVANNLNPKKQR